MSMRVPPPMNTGARYNTYVRAFLTNFNGALYTKSAESKYTQ
ncbi:hypothetical protein HMPREF9193_00252 [Treponema lecithinolyticum ATCC 700332]|uniref:Uncharacterized protein n=1 Tax=Treponema lecithinolyticum ATCC 700332 TaxID=1321815 RepID=A0ABN0P179_TRELE|nr:hypothetical protein HMPREF9193_00252 [Treponema lecithinolyticum ATCC 700332]